MKILFTTKTWEGDWQKFLAGAFDRKVKSCKYDFAEKWLMVNNGVPDAEFKADKVWKVSNYAKSAMNFFHLNKGSFEGGYYYSIAELVELYLARRFDYLCHLSSDALVVPSSDWISEGISLLQAYDHISVVSPRSEVNTWHNAEGLDQFFSDQCYLIQVKEFRQNIYNNPGTIKEYPKHGGNSFEHMVAKYLRANNKFRKVLDEHWVEHPAY